VIKELPGANWVTFAVGATSLAFLFLLPRWNKKIPAGLVVLFGSIAVSLALDLSGNYDVDVAGVLPQGLPSVALPRVSWQIVEEMILPAIGIFLLAYSEALGVAHEFGEKHHYEVDADQELTAHGFTNLVSGLFGGMIAAGGMSASAVKEGAGARTQVANITAWVVTLITLLFLTPLFTSLPEAVLAALIIHAVWHTITARKLQRILAVSRTEFALAALTLAGVLFIDVLQGMLIGLLASLLLIVYQSSRPHVSTLGRVPGVPGAYSDLGRHPENLAIPGLVILRMDAPVYYANAMTVQKKMKELVQEAQPPARAVLFDSVEQTSLDITSVELLKSLLTYFKDHGLDIYVAELHSAVHEYIAKTGVVEMVGEDHIFPTVEAAVQHFETSTAKS
jgi:sulfate permease, SulP family